MQPLFAHHPEVGGVRTRVLELEGDGPPVLLLHGYADSADTWRLVLDQLGRRDQRAIAVDLPGFGEADPLDPGRPVLEQLVDFAEAVVAEQLEGEPPLVVGNSLGGTTALLLAERRPAPAAVVPIGPAGFDQPRWFSIIQADPLVHRTLASPLPVPGLVVRAAAAEMYRRLAFARPPRHRPDVLVRFASHYAHRTVARDVLATGRRLLPELDRPYDHGRIACPVLLAWGERDRMVPHTGARHLLAALDRLEYELLDGLGHCPQLEDPERVADLVVRAAGLADHATAAA